MSSVFEGINDISPAVNRRSFPGGLSPASYHWGGTVSGSGTRPVRKNEMSIGADTRITALVWTNIWSSAVMA